MLLLQHSSTFLPPENSCEEFYSPKSKPQACGDIVSGCVTTGPKDHYQQDGCNGAGGEICGPSLATMSSPSGLIFGIVNIVGNFGTVFVDQSYWQGAIAVKPESAANGFILGGVVWFSVGVCRLARRRPRSQDIVHPPQYVSFPYVGTSSTLHSM